MVWVQGDCSAAPTNATVEQWNITQGPDLVELGPRQCIIVCDTDCLSVKANPIWMDSIYWRFKRTNRTDTSDNESPETQVRSSTGVMRTISMLSSVSPSNYATANMRLQVYVVHPQHCTTAGHMCKWCNVCGSCLVYSFQL